MAPLLISLLAATSAQAQEYYPTGAVIDDAAVVQLTEDGLNSIGDVAATLVPGSFPIDDVESTYGSGSSCFLSGGFWFRNAEASLSVDDILFKPTNDDLQVTVDLSVWLNSQADPFDLGFSAVCIGSDCKGWVEPFPVEVSIPIDLEVETDINGEKYVDAIVGDVTYDFELKDAIKFDGCAYGDIDSFMKQYLGFDMIDFFVDLIIPFVDPLIQSFAGEIEAQLEDALSVASVDEIFDLNGVPLHIKLYPDDIIIDPFGVQVVAGGFMEAPASDCVADYGVPGSLKTYTALPAMADNPSGTETVMHLSDDIANQALYAAWNGGLLCYTLSEEDSDLELPIPLNTSLLGILAGDAFDDIFPEEKPMVIRTAPRTPPEVDWNAGPHVLAKAHDLDVNFYAEIDHRMGRALGITVNADVPVNMSFDNTTGQLALDVGLDNGAVKIDATNNELVPSASADIEIGVVNLLDQLIGAFAGDLLDGLSFGLPSSGGLGLTSLEIQPTGVEKDWLGAYAKVGVVTYGGEGGCEQGCSSDGGCSSTSGVSWSVALFILPLLRRRRRA